MVWDNHGCMPLRPADESLLPQLQRYRDSGDCAVTLNVGLDSVAWHLSFEMLATFRRWISTRPEQYLLVNTADDIETAHATGRLGVPVGVCLA